MQLPSLVSWALPLCALITGTYSTYITRDGAVAAADVSACKLAANKNVYLSAGHGYSLNCAPSVGTLRAFMMFVDFPDQVATESSPTQLRDFFLPAAANWYSQSSYGKLGLSVTADTSRFYRMPAAATSYGWERGLSAEQHKKYIQDALAAYGGSISSVDVLYIVPTKNARSISFSPTYMGDVTTRSGTYVARKSVTIGYDAYATWGSLVINHESGHTMCLPDYYPLNGSATGLLIGGWDLMGLISGPSPDYFAWDKWRLGWLADDQIDCVSGAGQTSHTLTPLGVAGGRKAVVIKQSNTEALVAELRTSAGVDSKACANGILLYTVSTTIPTGEGPVKVIDARPNSGGCAGDELNDATLTLDGVKSYNVAKWGVEVTVVARNGDNYDIRVTRK